MPAAMSVIEVHADDKPPSALGESVQDVREESLEESTIDLNEINELEARMAARAGERC